MREDGGEQRFGALPDGSRPTPEAVRPPFDVAAMRARHVLGIGAMPAAAIAAFMGGDPPAAMEHLDGTRSDAHIDLGANERVWHRVEEDRSVDMVVEPDASETPFRIFVLLRRQRGGMLLPEGWRSLAWEEPMLDVRLDLDVPPALLVLADEVIE
jgi:hypothetical protein